MNYSEKGSKDEMSMEDILSSIRKYVAEDDEQNTGKKESEGSGSECCTSNEDVISLSASQVKEDTVSGHTDESSEDLPVYHERSTLSTGVITNDDTEAYKQRQSPFEQLTNALNAYGKKHKRESNAGAKTVEQLFSEIAEKIIQRWVDGKMESFVEKIVMREIEKIKAE